jgi:outer membrane protein
MRKLLVALVVMMSVGAVQAQSKFGHVNSQELLDTMPSRKAAMKELGELEERSVKELQEMEAELQKIYAKYMAEQSTLTPVMRQYEEERIQKKQQALQQREQELQQLMSARNTELNTPILKKVQDAIAIVADRKKLSYVIDETVTLYFKGGIDLTAEVTTELLILDKK